MAKRGRTVSLDKLLKELGYLDKQRKQIQASIQEAVKHAIGDWSGQAPTRGRPAGSKNAKAAPVRKKRTMSAKARKAISDAQKARWAKQKAGAKK